MNILKYFQVHNIGVSIHLAITYAGLGHTEQQAYPRQQRAQHLKDLLLLLLLLLCGH